MVDVPRQYHKPRGVCALEEVEEAFSAPGEVSPGLYQWVRRQHLAPGKRRVGEGIRNEMGWDGMGWDGAGREGMGWDGMRWNGIGWGGLGWDETGWNGMGWDGMG